MYKIGYKKMLIPQTNLEIASKFKNTITLIEVENIKEAVNIALEN